MSFRDDGHSDFCFNPNLRLSAPMWRRLPSELRTRLNAMVLQAVVAHALYSAPNWTFYPRDNNVFTPGTYLRNAGFTRATLTGTVDALAECGYLDSERTRPSAEANRRSRFRATPRLCALFPGLSIHAFARVPEPVRLKDSNKRPVALRPSRKVRELASEVNRINAALARLRIALEHPLVAVDAAGFLRLGDQRLDPSRVAYTRIFNERWNRGGRLYGAFWQSLPSTVRSGLRIDGEPVCEYDIRACHIQLLRAWKGLPPLPNGADPYAIDGIPRAIAKKAFLIALNCPNRMQAARALHRELRSEGVTELTARSIIDHLETAMPDLPLFTRAALRLQNLDSTVCVNVHLACENIGIPVLSVHDSFICQLSHRARVTEIVDREFSDYCDRLRRRAVRFG